MAKSRSSQHLHIVEQTLGRAAKEGLLHLMAEDFVANGRSVRVEDTDYVNFGSCSYLGLELDARIKAGTIDAVNRYGSQFASSRGYICTGLYGEAEALLGRVFNRPLILAPSLTLGHMSSIPVLVEDEDAVILDHQVHASVQMAVGPLRQRGVKVEMIRHNHMDMLESRIKKLQQTHKKVWYMADGIYSMYGDFAKLNELTELLNRYESFHLYIDDAHGSGWMGKYGAGFVHSQLPYHPRLFLTASLAKSFATAGGVLIFPDEESKKKVRCTGPTMNFSGPIQPPLLGAAIASIKIHLSPELPQLQKRLRERIAYFRLMATENKVPLFMDSASPIGFISVGDPEVAYNMGKRLKAAGYFTNIAIFPAVPYKNAGLRIAINNHLQFEDIKSLMDLIAEHLPQALAEENSSIEEVYEAFGMEIV
ncbi:MAG: aminotransferase class I/II-fold pyridoxal phosphate-dependent enzyme [Bacteroidota bacterium]